MREILASSVLIKTLFFLSIGLLICAFVVLLTDFEPIESIVIYNVLISLFFIITSMICLLTQTISAKGFVVRKSDKPILYYLYVICLIVTGLLFLSVGFK